MLMDPFYRTIEGFAIVIEKEWLSFGHKFQQRVAHGDPDFNNQERSPIFIQWLECVWNLTEQLPAVFEFDERLLMFLADHLYSGLFGNFLGDTDRARWTELRVRDHTTSIWSYVRGGGGFPADLDRHSITTAVACSSPATSPTISDRASIHSQPPAGIPSSSLSPLTAAVVAVIVAARPSPAPPLVTTTTHFVPI